MKEIGWKANTWNRAVNAAMSKGDGKPHTVEMYESSAPFCGTWYTAFVDGVREAGEKLLNTGTHSLVRREIIKAEGGVS